ncbi:MAG: TetR/AcrR family transcriptional regulator [Clostridium sp.]|nr:TetR/AcrR family transcriptional regulator [Clostridium sp.]MCM1443904.1 TetR/AcrR family transcriptional regulator [Candidatus Amulumruptor caecigallinarius]
MSETRMPTQKRSIEKRNRIIKKGFELMCEKGFYNTNTNEIAEYAGVSTGIIYQYFNDKKEIFIEGVKNYSNAIMYPMLQVLETEKIDIYNIENLMSTMIDKLIKNHTISKKAHEELVAMEHLDEDIANIFKESELLMTTRIVNLLKNNGIKIENAKEKIHIIIGIIDNLCHEIVYHKHQELNYDLMKKYVINIIKDTLI